MQRAEAALNPSVLKQPTWRQACAKSPGSWGLKDQGDAGLPCQAQGEAKVENPVLEGHRDEVRACSQRSYRVCVREGLPTVPHRAKDLPDSPAPIPLPSSPMCLYKIIEHK